MKPEELVELIVCPKCHCKLRAVETAAAGVVSKGLACESCQLLYALEDGLPNMLVSEARAWPQGSDSALGSGA